jgi:hypothetical protein
VECTFTCREEERKNTNVVSQRLTNFLFRILLPLVSYEFTMGATGAKVKARYSFVYVYENGQWKIAHHHSSQMPESIQPKMPVLSDQEVRKLFNKWNDALATLDPATVAARYAKRSILLPTVSDEPRATKEGITDYFVNFLQKQPQGVIKEGMVRAGPGWANDAGM